MAEDRLRPIFSALVEDPTQQDAIDAFVLALAERVDELQDCEARGDFGRLAQLAEELLLESAKAGYDSLSRCAASVREPAQARNHEDVRKALVELTEVAHRVRRGHRGAV